MNITSAPAYQAPNVSPLFLRPEVEAWFRFFAPAALDDPEAYRERLHVNTARGGWPRAVAVRPDVSTFELLLAHVEAGIANAPVERGGFHLRAVGLSNRDDDETSFVSLDFDGGNPDLYPPQEMVDMLAATLGEDVFELHSGSGEPGHFRLTFRLAAPAPVLDVAASVRRLVEGLGFPEAAGALEVYPSRKNNRLPFGAGGCYVHDREDVTKRRLVPFAEIMGRFAALRPVSLEIRSETRSSRRYNPKTRRDRPRPTPARMLPKIRRYWSEGLKGPGERDRVSFEMISDLLRRGFSGARALARMCGWVDEGKADASADVRRKGREWFKRELVGRVDRIYSTLRPAGRPDPMALSRFEDALLVRHSIERSRITGVPAEKILKLDRRVLPRMKAAERAGLPVLRLHSSEWQRMGGTHYAKIRAASGLYDTDGSYKALKTVLSRAHLGARPSEAYAMSWETCFAFEPAVVAIVPTWSTLASPVHEEALDLEFDVEGVGPASSCVSPKQGVDASDPDRKRLYVHHQGNREVTGSEFEGKEGEKHDGIETERGRPTVGRILFPRPRPRPPTSDPKPKTKPPPLIPGSEDMSMSEWLAAYDARTRENRARGARRAAVTRRRNALRRSLAEERAPRTTPG